MIVETSPTAPAWHGILVATALPLRDDLSVDYDAYAEHVRFLAAGGCQGVVPNGSLGEYQTLTAEERARGGDDGGGRGAGGLLVVPGVAAYGALEARRWTEQAAEAGCPAVMLLPPNAYRADAESVVGALPRGCQGRAADRRVQQPDRHQSGPDAARCWPGYTARG